MNVATTARTQPGTLTKDNESRTLRVSEALLAVISARIEQVALGRDDLLFLSTETTGGRPMSRNTLRTNLWLPALASSGLDFHVRMHELRHAHTSWLLAGGADLKTVMERMGHSQIMTTQKYLHTLPDADDKALVAFESVRRRSGAYLLPRLVRLEGQASGPGRFGPIRFHTGDTLGGMPIRSRVAAVVLAVLVSVGGLTACSGGSDSGGASGAVTTVTSSGAVKVLAEPGIKVIDVRTPAEYSSGHLPSAVNIDVEGSSFDQQIAGLSKTATYFVYCHSGNRSGVATDKMAKLGFTSIYNLQGGIADWQANGGAVVTE